MHDVTLGLRANERYTLTFGIRNLTDKRPPYYLQDTPTTPHQTAGNNTGNAYYDSIGRYLFVKVDARF